MMDFDMNGKKIKEIWFNGANGDKIIKAERTRTLELSATYHGDHDEFWIVEKSLDRIEIARYNPKYIASIVWLY